MKKLILIIFFCIISTAISQIDAESKYLYTPVRVTYDTTNNSITFNRENNVERYFFYLEEKNDKKNSFDRITVWKDLYDSNYTISNLEKGKLYEYSYVNYSSMRYTEREDLGFPTFRALSKTYLACGEELDPYTDRRTILILVDTTLYPELETEINRLKNDLVTEGWGVRLVQVNRMEPYDDVRVERVLRFYARGIIDYFYHNTDLNTEAIFIIGKNPKFYSGKYAPDDKPNHFGAWATDGLIGIHQNTNFMSKMGIVKACTKSDWLRNTYGPGGKYFDFNTFPYNVDLMVGSLDLSELSSFKESEVELLRRYLDKDHKYRTGQLPFRRRGLIDDNMPAVNYREAPASSGWRNFNSMFGPDSIAEGDYFSTLDSESYMASYACGVGHPFDSLDGVGSSKDFATRQVNTIFTMLYGDYIGDWDSPNNFLRAALASEPSILTAAWVGHPHWFFHHLSIGYPIGYCTRLTQNNQIYNAIEHFQNDTDAVNYDPYKNGCHIALLGDPTLTMYPLAEDNSVSNLTAEKVNDYTVHLSWDIPNDGAIHQYDIFRSNYEYGPFDKVNEVSTKNPEFTDEYHYTGAVWYMVREKVLEHSPTASFWKYLRGKITQTSVKSDVESRGEDYSEVYPNPTTGIVNIDLKSNGEVTYSILDISGRKLRKNIIQIVNDKLKIDLSEFQAGVYFIRINNNKLIKVLKM